MLLKADVPPAPRWTIGQEGEHQIAHQGSAKVLFYLGFDLAFALAKLPDTELVLRIQHRSGAIADDDRPFTTSKQDIKRDHIDLGQWTTRGIHKEIRSCQAFRAYVNVKRGRIGLAYHEEEVARAVHNCGATFTVRSIQSIHRRWHQPDGGAALYVPH